MPLNRRDLLIKGSSALAGLAMDRASGESAPGGTGAPELHPIDVAIGVEAAIAPVGTTAAHAFARRLARPTALKVAVHATPDGDEPHGAGAKVLSVTAGSRASPHIRRSLHELGIALPSRSESFVINLRHRKDIADLRENGGWHATICGADARGVLYGFGELLRRLSPADGKLRLAPFTVSEGPAIAQRGVYFATHFNNFYETAPEEEVQDYVEEMALWGFNHIWTWFDMHWYPEDFDTDPNSRGMQVIQRIRRINHRARNLGMTTGLVGVANEGFSHQPPEALRADPSDRRGQFYLDSTINPSAPGGLEMILRDRRKALSLIGPVDQFVAWPYDPGGCNCSLCHPWPRKFIELAPVLAREVQSVSPRASILLSTWQYRDDELPLMQSLADSRPDWLGGFISATSQLGKLRPAAGQASLVFPDISMLGSLFTGYGASGANPMPRRFSAEAAQTAAAGSGAVLYSEGMYEDVNKVVWARTLWSPTRSAQSVVEEYAGYYFGSAHAAQWSEAIMQLESTWPPAELNRKDPALVERLQNETERLLRDLPKASEGLSRGTYLRDRADMDARMVQIGSDAPLAKALMALLDEACYARDLTGFRLHVARLRDGVSARTRSIDRLYQAYWRYLGLADLTRSPVLFSTLPSFIGSRDWSSLLAILDQVNTEPNDVRARTLLLSGIKRWAWNGNISLEMVSV